MKRLLLGIALGCATACSQPDATRVRAVDLLDRIGDAEKRPTGGPFEFVQHSCGGSPRLSLAAPVMSRVTWTLRLPDRPTLTAGIAITGAPGSAATFRVGVSDGRIYELISTRTVRPESCATGWPTLEADLRRFAGRKLSLFYRPRWIRWQLIVGVAVESGAPERAFWGTPGIDADADAANAYYRRGR